MLLIDDAHCLPEMEKGFLLEAFRDSVKAGNSGLLIITLDLVPSSTQNAWRSSLDEAARNHFTVLNVPLFTLQELADIFEQQGDATGTRVAAVMDLAKDAGGSVKALLAKRAERDMTAISQAFMEAEHKGIEGVFGVAEVIAYLAARQEPYITKAELLKWIQGSLEHIDVFGWVPTEAPQQLVKEFSNSFVVRPVGQTIYFHLGRCRLLCRWLEEHNPSLLARAHYFWASHDLHQVGEMPMDPHAGPALEIQKRQVLKRGAWHLARIGLVLNQPGEILVDAAGLTDIDRRQQTRNMVAGLLNAAALWRAEGNLLEADDLVVDALEWLPQTDGEGHQALIETAADQLWQNYWLGGNPSTRAHLATLVMGTAGLIESPAWWIHQRYETLLSGGMEVTPLNPPCQPHSRLPRKSGAAFRSSALDPAALWVRATGPQGRSVLCCRITARRWRSPGGVWAPFPSSSSEPRAGRRGSAYIPPWGMAKAPRSDSGSCRPAWGACGGGLARSPAFTSGG